MRVWPTADSRQFTLPNQPLARPPAASGVHWKAGKDVTVKVLKKKAKPGAKGKPQTKTESVESFFRWFTEVPEVRAALRWR